MSWTDHSIEALKHHWMEGKSASQIASLLGNGLSRNAVIGKVLHRLGLAGRAKSPGLSSSAPPAFGAVAGRASPRRRAAPGAGCAADDALYPRLAIAPELLTRRRAGRRSRASSCRCPLRVTIVELKEAMCRWPLGDPASSEFRYCGSPAASGPYCAYHGSLAYQPAHERRRDRDRLRRTAVR